MLVRIGDARGIGTDSRLAWSLAAIAGSLNAAGFYAFGLYCSNMTGNVSTIADHVALGNPKTAAGLLGLVLAFVSGAATSALLANAGIRRGIVGIYAFSILAEGLLLSILGCVDLLARGDGRNAILAYGLSFLMGLQNAVVTRVSNARVRTTHVTGMITDIGIELGNLADIAFHGRTGKAVEDNSNNLRLHGITLLAFVVGGVVGVVAYRRLGGVLLLAAAACLLALAASGLSSGIRASSRRD
jgi:uncharacterized membrane protein YoaK (UPF0700 family)